MKIWNDCKSICKNEKGAYLVLVTSLLPLVFGFVGLAVDLGNFHAHTAKLQHASDAAALAGAAIYAANDETEESHPLADAAAEKYLKANLGTSEFASLTDTTDAIRYQVKSSGDVSYFRVYIEENLNTTFIRLIGAPFFTTPAGEAFATIPVSHGGGTDTDPIPDTNQISFDSLFSFDGKLTGTFNNNNGNDWSNYKNTIQSTYDGNIYCFNHGAYQYYKNDPYYQKLYTSDARDLPRYEANEKGYYTSIQEGNAQDFKNFTKTADDALKTIFDNEPTVVSLYGQNCTLPPPGSSSASDYYRVYSDSTGNLTINISNFSGDQDKPVYIRVEGELNLINVSLQSDIKRPVIFCYSGTTPYNPWYPQPPETPIHFSNNGHDFRGVLYTPYASLSPCNFESGTFTGTIITHDLELQSNHGKFVFEQFGIPVTGTGGSGSSGSGSSGGSSGSGSSGSGSGGSSSSGTSVELKLVPDPGLDWES